MGGIEPQHATFRLIAATHRDLMQRVRDEQFRADLYYRLAAFPIRLPALRDRRTDIPLLADSLLERLGGEHPHRLAADAIECLTRYDYPGNVRELRNILERASLMADGTLIERRDLPPEICAAACRSTAAANPVEDAGRRAFARAVAAHTGSRRELAESLRMSERTLYRRLRELERG